MIIHVSDILKDYGGKINVSGEVSIDSAEFLGENFVFSSPVRVDGKVVNNGKALEFDAVCHGKMKVHCARCMKEIECGFNFDVHETLAQDDGEVPHDEDIVLFSGDYIDVTDIIINNFLMNVSARYLCSGDCKGLCPTCGADLNEGSCKCKNQNVDPRWATLVDIIKSSDTE
ncbi:MAG: DUF177 domain-containing protein [Clostridia bacterium]|nr:DUF177 domain-containing protein [Clostridia bacterium]